MEEEDTSLGGLKFRDKRGSKNQRFLKGSSVVILFVGCYCEVFQGDLALFGRTLSLIGW